MAKKPGTAEDAEFMAVIEKPKKLFSFIRPRKAPEITFKITKKMTPKKVILMTLAAVVVVGGGFGIYRLFFYEEPVQMVTGTTVRDSITTLIEGSAVTSPTSFQRLTIPVDGTVKEVFVKQGDVVSVGDRLYTIDTESLEEDIASLESTIADYESQLNDLNESAGNLSVSAPFSGKLIDVTITDGDAVNEDTKLATLVDDSKMLLTLYFSVAYEDSISKGMSADVSVSQYMTQLKGTVVGIEKVSYITAEGAECFKVRIAVDNPGSLKKGLDASATITSSGTEMSPAEAGTLDYFQSKTILAGASGTISPYNMEDSLRVSSGEMLAIIDNDDYAGQITTLQKKINSSKLNLEDLNDSLAECSATADVAGTVIFVNMEPGDEVKSGDSSMAVYNTDTMQIQADINEVQNDYITEGMKVTITKSGASADEMFTGTVTKVSLEATSSNGVAYFPTTIEIDSGGKLSAGVYVSYSITAAQASDVILAPVAAIKQTKEGTCLFIKADAKPDNAVELDEGVVPEGYYAVKVETGLTSNNYVEITNGVSEGVTVFERYVSTGSKASGSDSTSQNSENIVQMVPGQFTVGQMPADFKGGAVFQSRPVG